MRPVSFARGCAAWQLSKRVQPFQVRLFSYNEGHYILTVLEYVNLIYLGKTFQNEYLVAKVGFDTAEKLQCQAFRPRYSWCTEVETRPRRRLSGTAIPEVQRENALLPPAPIRFPLMS